MWSIQLWNTSGNSNFHKKSSSYKHLNNSASPTNNHHRVLSDGLMLSFATRTKSFGPFQCHHSITVTEHSTSPPIRLHEPFLKVPKYDVVRRANCTYSKRKVAVIQTSTSQATVSDLDSCQSKSTGDSQKTLSKHRRRLPFSLSEASLSESLSWNQKKQHLLVKVVEQQLYLYFLQSKSSSSGYTNLTLIADLGSRKGYPICKFNTEW